MEEQEHMHLPPRGKIEWNLNTVIQVAGFVLVITSTLALRSYDLGAFASDVKAQDAKLTREVERIDNVIELKTTENAAAQAKMDVRIGAVESDTRKIENQAYRITVLEEAQKNTTNAVQDIRARLSDIASDNRVMREILQRMDKNNPGPTLFQDNDVNRRP